MMHLASSHDYEWGNLRAKLLNEEDRMPEVITQDELIQHLEEYEARIEELEAFVSKVANWKFGGDPRITHIMDEHDEFDLVTSQVEEAEAEALALLEP